MALGFLLLCLAAVGVISKYSLLTVLLDGLPALGILGSGVGLGFVLIPLLRLGVMPPRWHFLAAAALGLGVLSTLTLLLGLAGSLRAYSNDLPLPMGEGRGEGFSGWALNRSLWLGILAFGAGAGLLHAWRFWKHSGPFESDDRAGRAIGSPDEEPRLARLERHGWWLALPFAVLALLAAATPPGFLWSEEGFGYDVLEYHLQLPKEYAAEGRIAYRAHNVYANFPANVEMLYLLLMMVLGDPLESGSAAQLLHLGFGVLTVFAAWTIGRDRSRRCGLVCGLTMACCGWLPYLSGLAYVENGMLFFGMVAAGAMLRAVDQSRDREGADSRQHPGGPLPNGGGSDMPCPPLSKVPRSPAIPLQHEGGRVSVMPWVVLAGLAAGFSCGCKYTAAVMIAMPLALAVPLLFAHSAWSARLSKAGAFSLAVGLAFSPWLLKNLAMTGNPVFPLANRWFQAQPPGWGPEQTEQWERGHSLRPNERLLSSRLEAAWDHLVWDKHHRIGLMLFALTLNGILMTRTVPIGRFLCMVAAVQIAVWLLATHLFARFTVPLLIPLVLLAGLPFATRPGSAPPSPAAPSHRVSPRWRAVGAAVLIILGAAWNFFFIARLAWRELPLGVSASLFYDGQLPGLEYFGVVNRELAEESKILLIGEAKAFYFRRPVDYCVVFNRNPFAEAVQGAASDGEIVQWLRGRGYTHVLVHENEIRRLSKTYGFPEVLQPELFTRLAEGGLLTPIGMHNGNTQPSVRLFRVNP